MRYLENDFMKIEIKHRYTANVLFACEAENMREAILQAIVECADLSNADLSNTDLSDANLSNADLSNANLLGEILTIAPIVINGLNWSILITESFLTIGCKRFKHVEWASFDDEVINKMDYNASKFWSSNKAWLLAACDSHRIESLNFKKGI